MPYNVQPDLDGDTIVLAGPGATSDVEIMFFAFSLDETNGTISNINGAGNLTTTAGDSTAVSTSGTGQTNVTADGLGSTTFGDTNEGPL